MEAAPESSLIMEHKTLQVFAADVSSVELWLILAPGDTSRNSNSKGTDGPMTRALQGKHLAASLGGFKEPLRCTLMFSPSPNPGTAAASCFREPQMNRLTGPWHQPVHHRVSSARASNVSTVGLRLCRALQSWKWAAECNGGVVLELKIHK